VPSIVVFARAFPVSGGKGERNEAGGSVEKQRGNVPELGKFHCANGSWKTQPPTSRQIRDGHLRPSIRFSSLQAMNTLQGRQISLKAIGVVWRDGRLLAAEVADNNGRITGVRPLGGSMEFRELAESLFLCMSLPRNGGTLSGDMH
jgi:hypothetical protein